MTGPLVHVVGIVHWEVESLQVIAFAALSLVQLLIQSSRCNDSDGAARGSIHRS